MKYTYLVVEDVLANAQFLITDGVEPIAIARNPVAANRIVEALNAVPAPTATTSATFPDENETRIMAFSSDGTYKLAVVVFMEEIAKYRNPNPDYTTEQNAIWWYCVEVQTESWSNCNSREMAEMFMEGVKPATLTDVQDFFDRTFEGMDQGDVATELATIAKNFFD